MPKEERRKKKLMWCASALSRTEGGRMRSSPRWCGISPTPEKKGEKGRHAAFAGVYFRRYEKKANGPHLCEEKGKKGKTSGPSYRKLTTDPHVGEKETRPELGVKGGGVGLHSQGVTQGACNPSITPSTWGKLMAGALLLGGRRGKKGEKKVCGGKGKVRPGFPHRKAPRSQPRREGRGKGRDSIRRSEPQLLPRGKRR